LPQAHAELGRAYAAIGAFGAARRELEQAKRSSPPREVVAQIDRYLTEISSVEAERAKKWWDGYLQVGYGYDSNVNFATAQTQITLPAFGGVIAALSPASSQLGDRYLALNGGVGARIPVYQDVELVASGNAAGKFNSEHTQFDNSSLDLAAGVRFLRDEHQFDLVGLYQNLSIDYSRVRQSVGLSGDWRRVIAHDYEATVFGQLARLTYPQDSQHDADRTVVGAGVIPAFAGTRLQNVPALAALYFGQERERAAGVPQFGHELWGARFGMLRELGPRTLLFGGLSYERRRYGGEDPVFLETREDRQWDASLGVNYSLTRLLAIVPQLTYTENNSNIEVFKFRRSTASLAARGAF
jgi:hypothetical protein